MNGESEMNNKLLFFTFLAFMFIGNAFANNVNFTLEIIGIKINEGNVHVKKYSNKPDYKKDSPYISFFLESV